MSKCCETNTVLLRRGSTKHTVPEFHQKPVRDFRGITFLKAFVKIEPKMATGTKGCLVNYNKIKPKMLQNIWILLLLSYTMLTKQYCYQSTNEWKNPVHLIRAVDPLLGVNHHHHHVVIKARSNMTISFSLSPSLFPSVPIVHHSWSAL